MVSYVTGCAVTQHCYNGEIRPLSQNLSKLIRSMRETFLPNLLKICSRSPSGQAGEI